MHNFNQYRVIQLRPFSHENLVIGCGHGNHRWDEEGGGSTHPHKNADTVNLEMGMNPSVVAVWGQEGSNAFFHLNKHKKIIDEGPISYFMIRRLSEFVEACKCALIPSGSLLIPTHAWEYFLQINPYLQKNGFKNSGSVGDRRDLWRFDGVEYQWQEK